mgnify:FL=1
MTEEQLENLRERIRAWMVESYSRDPLDRTAPFHSELRALSTAEYIEVIRLVRRTNRRRWAGRRA